MGVWTEILLVIDIGGPHPLWTALSPVLGGAKAAREAWVCEWGSKQGPAQPRLSFLGWR